MADAPPDHRQILADARRMEAIASGDSRTYEGLIREESARLVGLALSLIGNHAEAEDVLQEAFLRLWQQAPAWQPRARVSTWLYRVVYRLSIDRLRQRRPTLDIASIEETVAEDAPSPEQIVWDRQREALIDWALAQLAPRQRAAVVLAHRQGLAQAEAASVLELTEDAYESLLARGRRRLKLLIAAAEQPAGRDRE